MSLQRKTPLARGTKGLKRTPLERGNPTLKRTELGRGTAGLDRGSSLERTGKLAPRSKARSKQMREDRVPLIESLVAAGVRCEVSMVFEELGIPHHCTGNIEGMHERRKSGAGGSRVNRANLIPACNWCNGYIEDAVDKPGAPYRTLIEESFLVLRDCEADRDEWEAMSKRNDRL